MNTISWIVALMGMALLVGAFILGFILLFAGMVLLATHIACIYVAKLQNIHNNLHLIRRWYRAGCPVVKSDDDGAM